MTGVLETTRTIRSGKFSAECVLNRCLADIDKVNPILCAANRNPAERGRLEARRIPFTSCFAEFLVLKDLCLIKSP